MNWLRTPLQNSKFKIKNSKKVVSIIVAVAENGVIGCANRLIWHISADLKRFKHLTTGHGVIMGRKTYESIGCPLPNRRNVMISHNKDLHIQGITVAHSLDEAVGLFASSDEVFVIGGGDIYRQAMPIADKLYVTLVSGSPNGDTVFPAIDAKEWRETSRDDREGYSFVNYERATGR